MRVSQENELKTAMMLLNGLGFKGVDVKFTDESQEEIEALTFSNNMEYIKKVQDIK